MQKIWAEVNTMLDSLVIQQVRCSIRSLYIKLSRIVAPLTWRWAVP